MNFSENEVYRHGGGGKFTVMEEGDCSKMFLSRERLYTKMIHICLPLIFAQLINWSSYKLRFILILQWLAFFFNLTAKRP